jgi:23S rRNA pseudouridine1911/1915/1917 synthase
MPAKPTPSNPVGEPGTTVTFTVASEVTERLDRFLADQLRVSRTVASRLIGEGHVRVNAAVGRAGRALQKGDRVTVTFPEPEPPRSVTPHHIPLSVVHEDDVLLVIDKPAGLVVHPAPGHWNDTLVNALAARGVRLASGAPGRPGIVHRLDRDTSGLMVIAKTDDAHRRLGRAMAARRVVREYAALVWGHPAAQTISAPLARHARDRKRIAVTPDGRAAVTHVFEVARFGVADLIRVRLETGRTHQIRVHLSHVGHPVVGDPVYGGGGSRRVTGHLRPLAERLEKTCPRQALHAAVLRFEHPTTGEPVVFRSEWPDDLRAALGEAAHDANLLARPDALAYLGFFKEDG